MSRFFPHADYPDDQPLTHTILATHVLYRGFQSGALIGPIGVLPWYLFSKPTSSIRSQALIPKLIRSAGVGSLVGTAFLSVGLAARMWDKEPIEWADRSWRLLENKGQVEVDDWSCSGAVLGTAAAILRKPNMGWKGVLGGTGLGSLMGVCGYMVYRHGIKGGKWEEDASSSV